MGINKCASNIASRSELGRYPVDGFIKTQSLLYEDRLLSDEIPDLLKECYSLSKSLHEQGQYSWFTYVNHLRIDNDSINDYTNININHNKKQIKLRYKSNFESIYIDMFNDKMSTINENSKLNLFKTIKNNDYKTEHYLNFPDSKARRLICKFRISDHPLAIETGRYSNIPRNMRLCNTCNLIDDEYHFSFIVKLTIIFAKNF